MSAPAGPTRDPDTGRLVLDDETRNALQTEYFARLNAREPNAFHCFCGDDQDLVDAVTSLRQRDDQDRERE